MASSSDCTEKASCTDDGGESSGGGARDGSGGREATGEGSDSPAGDGSDGPAGDRHDDATSAGSESGVESGAEDVAGDTHGRGDSIDEVAVDATTDAGGDAATNDGALRDAAVDAVARPDGCVDGGVENCTNGVDDNCDGLVDCADPQCAAYQCAPALPAMWIGPVQLWTGDSGATPPSCPAEERDALDLHAGPTGGDDTCGCTCSAAGQTCSVIGTYYSDQACTVAGLCSATTVSSTCTAAPMGTCGGTGGSFNVGGGTAPTPTGGSCTAHVTATPGPAPGWTTSARVCACSGPTDSPGGCGASGDQCVLGPSAGFGATPCVYQAGDIATCPGAYPNKNLFYSGESDSRGCGTCACSSAPAGGSCSGTVGLWGGLSGACVNGADVTYTLGDACASFNALASIVGYTKGNVTVTAGTCSVTAQPPPTGSVTGSGPVTVCCK